MGWYRRTSTFGNCAFRFCKSKNTLFFTHKPNSRTKPFSTISKFSQPNLINKNPIQESISIPKLTSKIFRSIIRNKNPIQESLSRTKPFSKISKLSQSILRNKNPVQESISIPKPTSKIFQSIIRNRNPIQKSIHTSRISQSILRNLNLHNGLKQKNPLLDGAKRFHHQCMARSNEITLITEQRKRWYESVVLLVSAFLIASGVLIIPCFGNLETVPYSKRTHFVLLPRTLEKNLGNFVFKILKEADEGEILAPDHPNSIRVQRISQALFEAAEKGLSKEHILCRSSGNVILDDDLVIKAKKGKAQRKKEKPETEHLESFEWEVVVVDDPEFNAFCLPGGKIVVFTGLLRYFEDDDEVAMIIGHEVGHAVARHTVESLLKMLWWIIVKMFLWQSTESRNLASTISNFLFKHFVTLRFSRRDEMEADYIGMLLAASAGYDPRVAPKLYEKLGELSGTTEKDDYLSTHPHGKTRAEKLSQAEVMEEALSIYRQQTNNLILCSQTPMT